jgi:hypothetical protein
MPQEMQFLRQREHCSWQRAAGNDQEGEQKALPSRVVADKESGLRRSSIRCRTTRRAMSRSKSLSGGTLKMSTSGSGSAASRKLFGVARSVGLEIDGAAAERRLDRDQQILH